MSALIPTTVPNVFPAGELVGPETLIKELAHRDRRAAMELVVRRYAQRLTLYAGRLVGDEAEARDVVQEVLIKAMREERLFDEGFRIQAWLYRVTRNLCFNLSRDRRRRHGILSTHELPRSIPGDPLEQLFGEEQKDGMMGAIDQLSEDHREILMLRYYEDLSYSEIADALHIKLGTVMSRLSRARDRLLSVLADNETAESMPDERGMRAAG